MKKKHPVEIVMYENRTIVTQGRRSKTWEAITTKEKKAQRLWLKLLKLGLE